MNEGFYVVCIDACRMYVRVKRESAPWVPFLGHATKRNFERTNVSHLYMYFNEEFTRIAPPGDPNSRAFYVPMARS